jgi:hypothetical protein
MGLNSTRQLLLAAAMLVAGMLGAAGPALAQAPTVRSPSLHGVDLSMTLQQAQAVLQAELGPLRWRTSESKERGQVVHMHHSADVNPDLEVALSVDPTGRLLLYFREQKVRTTPPPKPKAIISQAVQKFGQPFLLTSEATAEAAAWGADLRGKVEPPNSNDDGVCRAWDREPQDSCAWLIQVNVFTVRPDARGERLTVQARLSSPALLAQANARALGRVGVHNNIRF